MLKAHSEKGSEGRENFDLIWSTLKKQSLKQKVLLSIIKLATAQVTAAQPIKGLIRASTELWNSWAIGQSNIAPPVNRGPKFRVLSIWGQWSGLVSQVPSLGNAIGERENNITLVTVWICSRH